MFMWGSLDLVVFPRKCHTMITMSLYLKPTDTNTHGSDPVFCYPLGPRPLHLSAVPAVDHPSTLFTVISQQISPNSKQKNPGLFFMMFLHCYFMLNQIKKHGLFRRCDLSQGTTAFLKAPVSLVGTSNGHHDSWISYQAPPSTPGAAHDGQSCSDVRCRQKRLPP